MSLLPSCLGLDARYSSYLEVCIDIEVLQGFAHVWKFYWWRWCLSLRLLNHPRRGHHCNILNNRVQLYGAIALLDNVV